MYLLSNNAYLYALIKKFVGVCANYKSCGVNWESTQMHLICVCLYFCLISVLIV